MPTAQGLYAPTGRAMAAALHLHPAQMTTNARLAIQISYAGELALGHAILMLIALALHARMENAMGEPQCLLNAQTATNARPATPINYAEVLGQGRAIQTPIAHLQHARMENAMGTATYSRQQTAPQG